MTDDIEAKIAELKERIAQEQSPFVRDILQKEFDALCVQSSSDTSGDITVNDVEGKGVAAGHGARATNQEIHGGRDVINSPQIVNLGNLVYGDSDSAERRQQLVWYLRILANTMNQLPLQGIEQRLSEQGQGMSLSSVYTHLKVQKSNVLYLHTSERDIPPTGGLGRTYLLSEERDREDDKNPAEPPEQSQDATANLSDISDTAAHFPDLPDFPDLAQNTPDYFAESDETRDGADDPPNADASNNAERLPDSSRYKPMLPGSSFKPQLRAAIMYMLYERDEPERDEPEPDEVPQVITATEAVTHHRHLILLGDPGSGKSTFVRYLALTLAHHALDELLDDTTLPADFGARLPIILPLRKLARRVATGGIDAATVFDALTAEMYHQKLDDVTSLLHKALGQGVALLLFDGLDEVPVEGLPGERASRLETLQAVRAFALAHAPLWGAALRVNFEHPARHLRKNALIVTCRVRAFTEDLAACLEWPITTLMPFDLTQVNQFVPAWYAELAAKTGLAHDTARLYTERLVERIATSRQLTEMAGTPLLLTMMALVLYNKGDLPRDRPQLYEDILDLLLGRWDTVQERGGQTLADYIGMPEWDTKRILPLLDRLSYTAHRTASSEDGRGRLAKQTVRETLIDFFEQAGLPEWAAFEKAGRCIEYIQQRSGLLIPDENESYMFAHLTLQEHCAGRYIVLGSEDPVKLVLEHRIDDRWHEPIMLGLGLAPPADLDDVLEALVQPDENGQRKSSEHWYQDLVLVSEIGADREWTYLQTLPRIKVAQHQEHLRRGLATIGEDPHVQHTTRIEAMSLLGTLGRDPRLLDPATGTSKDTHYWCSVEAGKFWSGVKIKQLQPMTLPYSFQIARYPVTNGEYRQFIAAGGYDAPCCWSAHGWRHKTKRNWHAPRYWDNSRFNNPVQPVVGLSWWEAAAYCRWLTVQGHAEGWLPHDHQIRLPTSLEWERAARHTDQRLYPWGTTAPTPERANYKDTGIGKPSPVGYFPAGAAVCGAQDIVGNVMEYLALSARQAAQQQLDDDVTPDASVTITLSYYNDPASRLLLGKYGQFRPDYRHNKCGFRLVRVQLGYPGTGGVKTCMKKTTSG